MINRYLRALGLISLSAGLGLLLTGCVLRLMVGRLEYFASVADITYLNTTIDSHATMVLCHATPPQQACTFYVDGEDVGSTVRLLSEQGVIGWFIDPLIAQVPASVYSVTATYDIGAGPRPLSVAWVDRFKVNHSLSVTAESGYRFLILELPPPVEALVATGVPTTGVPISYSLRYAYTLPTSQASQPQTIKLMMTGRVELNGHKYYVPLLPCVTDFAQVPALVVPASSTAQDLVPALGALPAEGCDDVAYFFNLEAAPQRVFLPLFRQ